MEDSPKWVPPEVSEYWSKISNGEKIDAFPVVLYGNPIFRRGVGFLRDLIESPQMERAWKAVGKRSASKSPIDFANIIIDTTYALEEYSRAPSVGQLQAFEELSAKIDRALHEFDATTKYILIWDSTSIEILRRDAQELRNTTECIKEEWKILGSTIPNRESHQSKRIFLIRWFGRKVKSLYGQPLYGVVALSVATVLREEPLDLNHVMKLLKARSYVSEEEFHLSADY